MSTYTKNLNLFKYDVTADEKVPFSITKALNNNWDIIDSKCGSSNNILDFKWSDHILNDQSWLRADTFSWQNGTTYSLAYNELLSEYNNSASTTKTEGGITFKRTPKGYKIALATQETAILNKYNSEGIAWYYILDTTNKKFKLPRTKFGFEGLRTSVGNDIEAGLPDHNHTVSFYSNYGWNGITKLGSSDRSDNQKLWIFTCSNASKSNPIYGNNSTVQPPATQMYLYFYVGNFTKSAESQTAGLKAELLNSKVDTSSLVECQVVINTYVNGTSGYRIWSDGYCEQWGLTSKIADFGTATVNLLKSFKDLNYTITKATMMPASGDDSSYNDATCIRYASRTNSSFQIYNRGATDGGRFVNWKACGYIV